ncbi:hypothetical protein BG011_004847 [Mortierella polycephala]|uniref:Uncharacterized protein n=1 Tax=Mortierella polycephala TaxID=41804 RepID=A0A9P6Q0P0_9FUNG|nr:hypothetical protein BG011_004847 [Mortierella polycephala]
MVTSTPPHLLPPEGLRVSLPYAISQDSRLKYFVDHPLEQWVPESYLEQGYTDMEQFFGGLEVLRIARGVDNQVRVFCWRLQTYYQSTPEGKRHMELLLLERRRIQEQAKFHVASEGSLFREGTKRAGELDDRPAKGARRRQTSLTEDKQDDGTNISGQRITSVSPAATGTGIMIASNSPFLDDAPKDDEKADVVALAEVGTMFDVEDFDFTGSIDGLDVGADFNPYFKMCCRLKYDKSSFPDFLAVNGVLFLRDQPTTLQDECFGHRYSDWQKKLKRCIPMPAEDAVQKALAAVRKWKDTYEFTLRKVQDTSLARAALKKVVEQAEDSSLKELFLHGCARLSSVKTSPLSEADQTSSFILPVLSCIMTRPDECRLAHTATVPTSGSVFVRLCRDLSAPPKHPDLVAQHSKSLDIAFGEVSFASDTSKDVGDLCRLAIWSKRALDQLDQQYAGTEELCVLFFQIVSTRCTLYQMRRVGTVNVAVQVGQIEIAQDLPGLISFDQHVFTWVLLDLAFSRLLENVGTATKNKRVSPPGCYYRGPSTPSARKMSNQRK